MSIAKTKPSTTPVLFTPHIGVEVSNIDLGTLQIDDVFPSICELLDHHLVVVIRNQSLDAHQLRDFVARFGPLFRHHADVGVLFADGVPEVLEMRKEPDGQRLFGGSDWHADVTFRKPSGYVSALHAKILPPVGGDTGFASAIAACGALSDGMKALLDSLQAVHSYDGPGRPEHAAETAVHPVIRRHPVTGKHGIYLNRMFVTRFADMTEDESRPLIDYLDHHMSRPEFCFRHRWAQGDLLLWDNRFTLHYPINDFIGHRRLLIRCTALES